MDLLAEIFCAYYVAAHIEAFIEAAILHPTLLGQNARIDKKPMSQYTMDFLRRAPHLRNAEVASIRNYVIKRGPFVNDSVAPDLPKSNRKAAEVRQVGNRLYLAKDYLAALEKFNESICWAEGPDSEHLGIGYANRSAVYYDMGEYEVSLVNIELAKKHHYPERLMPKLLARELNCKQKIANGHSKRAKPCHKLAMNVEPNPNRPFMADGIVQKEIPGYGRSMVAQRGFKAGDVILQEKAMLAAIAPELKYKNCNHCSMENFHSLIPCPKCVSVMYCNQECLEKGWHYSHRFECGITEKLHHISQGSSRIYMGSRAFFYGLTLFGDNVKNMMSFCKANGRTGGDPFTLDYTNYDPLEEFKIFHKIKLPTDDFQYEDSFRFYAAVYYSIYIKHPLVRSIFATKPQKDFLLCSILDYMRIVGFLVIGPRQNFTTQLYSIASVCNHSCDPNTVAATHFGELKFIAIRPIAIDEQILISYGPLVREHTYDERQQALSMYHFDCSCDSCDDLKMRRMKAAAKKLPAVPHKHLMAMKRLFEDPETNAAAKLNMLQQFVERYVYAYPRDDYVRLLDVYRDSLISAFVAEVEDQLRANAA